MFERLIPVCLIVLAGCVSRPSQRPLTLVELHIEGTPKIVPGGPSIYIDDVYRGNPVDSRFSLWLEVGDHEVRFLNGSSVLFQDTLTVTESATPQKFDLKYDAETAQRSHGDAELRRGMSN